MAIVELHQILSRDEDSRHQFKRDFTNVDAWQPNWWRSPVPAAATC
jgi:hypothetical protein